MEGGRIPTFVGMRSPLTVMGCIFFGGRIPTFVGMRSLLNRILFSDDGMTSVYR